MIIVFMKMGMENVLLEDANVGNLKVKDLPTCFQVL